MLLQLLDEVFAGLVLPFLAENNGRLDHHTTDIIGHTGDGTLYHGGVRHQGTLHLERTDTVAGGFDHIVDTTLKPIVAVLIAPGHVACVVKSVVPGLTGQFRIAIVLLEETDGLAVTDTHHNLTFLTILTGRTVGTDQVDIVLGIGNTHRAGLRRHPGEGAEGHRGLCLTETFHHLDARLLVELIKDGWVQGLAGSGAVFETRQVIFRQVLTYHETVDGGWCAETRHLVFLHLTQEGVGIELLMVEHEHRCTGKPLTIELSPDGLAPTGISYRQMERALMKIVPEHTCGEMTHGIEIVVCNHLRLAAGTRGEVHQHRIVIRIHKSGFHELRCLFPFTLPVVESLRNRFAMIRDGDILLYGGTLRHGGLNLAHHIGVVHTDDGFYTCTGIAVYNVMLCQHVGGGNHDGTDLAEGKHHHPPLIATLQDQHHGVVLADA